MADYYEPPSSKQHQQPLLHSGQHNNNNNETDDVNDNSSTFNRTLNPFDFSDSLVSPKNHRNRQIINNTSEESSSSPILKIPLPPSEDENDDDDQNAQGSPILRVPLTPTDGTQENAYQQAARKQQQQQESVSVPPAAVPISIPIPETSDDEKQRRINQHRRKIEMEKRIQEARDHQWKVDHQQEQQKEGTTTSNANANNNNKNTAATKFILNARQLLNHLQDMENHQHRRNSLDLGVGGSAAKIAKPFQYLLHTFEVGMADQSEDELRLRYSGGARYFFGFLVFIALIFIILSGVLFSNDSSVGLAIGFLIAGLALVTLSCSLPTARLTVIDVKTGNVEFYKNSIFCSYSSKGCCFNTCSASSCSVPLQIADVKHVRKEVMADHGDLVDDNQHHQQTKNEGEAEDRNHQKDKQRIHSSSSTSTKRDSRVDVYLGFKEQRLNLFLETHAIKGELLVYSFTNSEDGNHFAEILQKVIDGVKSQALSDEHAQRNPTLIVTKKIV